MIVLGISGSSHDPTVTIVCDGEVLIVVEQERLSRIKHAPKTLPIEAVKVALRESKISSNEIDRVAFFLDPDLFEKNVYKHVFLKDWKRYLLHPLSYRTFQFISRGKRYRREAYEVIQHAQISAPIDFVSHHLSHAAIAFWGSSFQESMVLTIDNMGELDSTMLAHGVGPTLNVLKTISIPHSLGMLYGAITNFLGFRPWNDEGKVMALSSFGKPLVDITDVVKFHCGQFKLVRTFQMHQSAIHNNCYHSGLKKIFGKPRLPNEPLRQRHADIAATAQYILEETAKKLVYWMFKRTGCSNLCLAGGVAQNCKLNGELLKMPEINRIYVPPFPGDAGASVGAALLVWSKKTGKRPKAIRSASLGRSFSEEEFRIALAKFKFMWRKSTDIYKETVSLLKKSKAIAFYHGRSEAGPRALGNRSILALPESLSIKDYINKSVKHRESWRPFGSAILASAAEKYFPGALDSYFMNIACKVTKSVADQIPAVVHIDQSARVQIVVKEENPKFAALLEEVEKATGVPILLNTSYNKANEPIVDSPYDALQTFSAMPIKHLVIEDYIVSKE